MVKREKREDTATRLDDETIEGAPRPRVRSARMIRTLVMTALAALPMKACSGARQAPVEHPRDGVAAEEDAGATAPDDGDTASARAPDRTDGAADAREPPAADGSGRVWRGGGDHDARPEPADATRSGEDGSGRVWRGAPGEDRHHDDRDAGEPDDARRRDDVPPPVPAYGVEPVPEYGVPEPVVRPMYAVEPPPVPAYGVEPVPEYMVPLPGPITEYGAPVPPPVSEYAAPAPDDDDGLGAVLRYGLPYPR